MHGFDNALIEKVFSPVVGWIHERVGLDQWKLSIECLNGSIAFYLAGVAFTIARKGMSDGIFTTLLSAMLWLGAMQFARHVAMRQAGSSLGRQSARMQEWIFRHILVCLLPLSLYYVRGFDNLCFSAALALLVSHLYFKACDMPPPRRSGRRQLAHARG